MKITKGIILAGGNGTRLYPLTIAANKQLLPIYDKPVIYYPLTTLMLAGIRDILIISTPRDLPSVQRLLGDGSRFGMRFEYQVQNEARGLPEAFILGKDFINNSPVAMILGDNFFHGQGLSTKVQQTASDLAGANIFTYMVEDASRYGVAVIGDNGQIIDIEEKPLKPRSNMAITGLYYFDGSVSERSQALKPSKRNELEITDLMKSYMREGLLSHTQLGRGYVWFDVGTPHSLLSASNYVEVIQSRQGIAIASPEEVALRMGFIDQSTFEAVCSVLPDGFYKKYLLNLQK
jgi:glucose-1-phosphate thymidylyltransferase